MAELSESAADNTKARAAARPPAALERFDRAAHIPPNYDHRKHIFASLALVLAILTAAGALAWAYATWTEWLLLPVFLLIGNFIEWAFHRYPMHKPKPGARILYVNHTLIHHRAFHHDNMPMAATREYNLILMPPFTAIVLMVLASPAALVAGFISGPGAAGIFYIFAVLYYLHYEVLHSLFHQPEAALKRWGLLSQRWFVFMRNHHAQHHRLDRMSRANFNVTVPISDFLFGTLEPPALDKPGKAVATTWVKQLSAVEQALCAEQETAIKETDGGEQNTPSGDSNGTKNAHMAAPAKQVEAAGGSEPISGAPEASKAAS